MTSSGLKVALAGSLALNLFIIGAVVGAAGMQAREHQQRQRAAAAQSARSNGIGNPLMRAAEVLPEAKREAYIARLKAEGENAKADFAASRAARVEASDLIGAPTFDPNAISSRLAAARNSDMAARARFETAVIEFAATLTPEERKALGERVKPRDRGNRDRNNRDRNDRRDGDRQRGPDGAPPAR